MFVDVEGDARRGTLRRRNGDAALLRRAATDVEFLLAGAVAGPDDVRQVFNVLVEGLHPELAQCFAGYRLQGNGDILRALGALGRGDDDGFEFAPTAPDDAPAIAAEIATQSGLRRASVFEPIEAPLSLTTL